MTLPTLEFGGDLIHSIFLRYSTLRFQYLETLTYSGFVSTVCLVDGVQAHDDSYGIRALSKNSLMTKLCTEEKDPSIDFRDSYCVPESEKNIPGFYLHKLDYMVGFPLNVFGMTIQGYGDDYVSLLLDADTSARKIEDDSLLANMFLLDSDARHNQNDVDHTLVLFVFREASKPHPLEKVMSASLVLFHAV